MRFYRNLGQGAVILINSNEGYPLLDELTQAIAAEYEWPDALPKEKPVAGLANIHDYAGLYTSKAGAQFRVGITGGGLTLQVGQQPPLPLFAASDVEFFARAVSTSVQFERRDKAGSVSLTVSQDGNQIRADRQA
jgi:hypothetical protein